MNYFLSDLPQFHYLFLIRVDKVLCSILRSGCNHRVGIILIFEMGTAHCGIKQKLVWNLFERNWNVFFCFRWPCFCRSLHPSLPSSLFKERFYVILYYWKISVFDICLIWKFQTIKKVWWSLMYLLPNFNDYLRFVSLVLFIHHTHFPLLQCFRANPRHLYISLFIRQCIHQPLTFTKKCKGRGY